MSLDPSTEEARRLLAEELSKAKYAANQPSLLERLKEWILGLFRGAGTEVGAPGWLVPVVVIVLLALIGLLLWRILRREPGAAATPTAGAVLEGPVASAADLRASAERAFASGDASTAALESFRAIVVAGIERALLDDHPGRTAHEAARDLTPFFDSEAVALAAGADLFDAVRYGARSASAAQARDTMELELRLSRAKPRLPEPLGAPW